MYFFSSPLLLFFTPNHCLSPSLFLFIFVSVSVSTVFLSIFLPISVLIFFSFTAQRNVQFCRCRETSFEQPATSSSLAVSSTRSKHLSFALLALEILRCPSHKTSVHPRYPTWRGNKLGRRANEVRKRDKRVIRTTVSQLASRDSFATELRRIVGVNCSPDASFHCRCRQLLIRYRIEDYSCNLRQYRAA